MDPLLRQLVHVFADEVNEQALKIAQLLLAMEREPARIATDIEELYRQAHSLKGSSSSLAVNELERLAHTLEEALTGVRRKQSPLTPELVDVALRAMDMAKLRVSGLIADTAMGLAEVEAVTAELRGFVSETGDAVTPPVAPPQPRDDEPAEMVVPETQASTGTVRVAAQQLVAIERRVDELRAVRGRLDTRSTAATTVTQTLERMWQEARGEAPGRADVLYQLLRLASSLRRDLADDATLVQAAALELDEDLRSMRMVPAVVLMESLQRALRDACRRTEKDARLLLSGGETQIDRRLLEQLKSPLLHMVRNAVDHGVEPPEVREAIGKPSQATVAVSIEQRGRDVLIQVRDDGRGVDVAAVRARAVEQGFLDEAAAQALSDGAAFELLFRSGLSTAEVVTELSGRGVGLDVVREAAIRLHGRVEISSKLGEGTTLTLWVPLTVAATELMIIEESGRPFALPQSNLEQILRVEPEKLYSAGRRLYFRLEDQPVPVVRLASLLGLTERHEGGSKLTMAILRVGEARLGMICERLLGTHDLVLRPLPLELQSLPLLSAAAILPNGQAVLVLSARDVIAALQSATSEKAALPGRPETILIADDSITTRSLLRTALEASGFRVRTATDGEEALRLALAERFDLVVSDVRMPRLDGFGLTARLSSDPRTKKTPVVLFSSLDSEDDRRRGVACGAKAYLTKSAFDRGQLLDIVTSLIRGA